MPPKKYSGDERDRVWLFFIVVFVFVFVFVVAVIVSVVVFVVAVVVVVVVSINLVLDLGKWSKTSIFQKKMRGRGSRFFKKHKT